MGKLLTCRLRAFLSGGGCFGRWAGGSIRAKFRGTQHGAAAGRSSIFGGIRCPLLEDGSHDSGMLSAWRFMLKRRASSRWRRERSTAGSFSCATIELKVLGRFLRATCCSKERERASNWSCAMLLGLRAAAGSVQWPADGKRGGMAAPPNSVDMLPPPRAIIISCALCISCK